MGLLCWPLNIVEYGAPLDRSWVAGLQVAWDRQLVFGRDLAFSYGPLGAADFPAWYRATPSRVGAVMTALTVTVLAFLMWRALHRCLPSWLSWLLTYVLLRLTQLDVAQLALLVVVLLVVEEVGAERSRSLVRLASAALLADLLLLTSASAGLTAVALVSVALLLSRLSLRQRLGIVLAAGLVQVLLWTVLQGSMGTLPAYLKSLVRVSQGYRSVALEDPRLWWQYPLAAAAASAIVWLCFRSTARWRLLVISSMALVLAFEHGFVRHDGHAVAFFVVVATLMVALAAELSARAVLLPLVVTLVVLFLSVGAKPVLFRPWSPPVQAVGDLKGAVSGSEARRLEARARSRLEAEFPVEPRLLARVGSATVHIDPDDTALVAIHSLNWRPVPMFQTFTAYTSYLDRLDAAALEGPQAPSFVLSRTSPPAYDGRIRAFDAPQYALALVCRYRVVDADPRYELLQRGPDRCGPPLTVGRTHRGDGQSLRIARTPPGMILTARITVRTGVLDSFLGVVFKPRHLPCIRLNSGPCHRLVSGTAAGGLILAAPPGVPRFAVMDGPSIDTVTVEGADWDVQLEQRRVSGTAG